MKTGSASYGGLIPALFRFGPLHEREYTGLGPFRFDRADYDRALDDLVDAVAEPS